MNKKPLEIRDKTIFDGFMVKYILKLIFKIWFKLTGWQAIKLDHEGAGITIAAPHTSNWDVIYAMGAAIILDIKIYFSIKESWCRKPVIGRLMMWMGMVRPHRKKILLALMIAMPMSARIGNIPSITSKTPNKPIVAAHKIHAG